jgi:hypothetical protein
MRPRPLGPRILTNSCLNLSRSAACFDTMLQATYQGNRTHDQYALQCNFKWEPNFKHLTCQSIEGSQAQANGLPSGCCKHYPRPHPYIYKLIHAYTHTHKRIYLHNSFRIYRCTAYTSRMFDEGELPCLRGHARHAVSRAWLGWRRQRPLQYRRSIRAHHTIP